MGVSAWEKSALCLVLMLVMSKDKVLEGRMNDLRLPNMDFEQSGFIRGLST